MAVDRDQKDDRWVVVGSRYDFCAKMVLKKEFSVYFWGQDTGKKGNHELDYDLYQQLRQIY